MVDAIAVAAPTSGRSVLVSGLTVLLAMSGMFLTGSKIFTGMGQSAMLVVAVAVIGSADPASRLARAALLALLGHRVECAGASRTAERAACAAANDGGSVVTPGGHNRSTIFPVPTAQPGRRHGWGVPCQPLRRSDAATMAALSHARSVTSIRVKR